MGTRILLLTVALGLAAAGSLSAQQPANGAALFAKTCASCHGANGTPAPGMARAMGVPDFRAPATLASLTDSALRATVANGKGRMMPAFKSRLSPAEIAAVAEYLRTLSKH